MLHFKKTKVILFASIFCLITLSSQLYFLNNINQDFNNSISTHQEFLFDNIKGIFENQNELRINNQLIITGFPGQDANSFSGNIRDQISTQSKVKILYSGKTIPFVILEIDEARDHNLLVSLIKSFSIKSILPNQKILNLINYESPVEVEDSIPQLNTDLGRRLVDAESLWNSGLHGKGVTIAIIDSGIDETHLDLVGAVTNHNSFINTSFGWEDFEVETHLDQLGHGTACAGIAAGRGNASEGLFSGIAPAANLVNAKIFDAWGRTTGSAILAAIDWVLSINVDVISMSYGGGPPDPYADDVFLESALLRAGVDDSVVSVASAGNSGPGYFTSGIPSAIPGVISVGAFNTRNIGSESDDQSDLLATYSSRGPTYDWRVVPDVLAPSTIYTAIAKDSHYGSITIDSSSSYLRGNGSDYWLFSGTSASTPLVAGVIALLTEGMRKELNNNTIKGGYASYAAIVETANSLPYNDVESGKGMVNASAALEYLLNNKNGNDYDVSTVIANSLPLKPFGIHYPGDISPFNITIISTQEQSIFISYSSSISEFISIDSSSFISRKGLSYISGYLYSEINSSSGLVKGDLNITIGTTVNTIPVEFEIQYPKLKILFDNIHSVDGIDVIWNGYSEAFLTLIENGYEVDMCVNPSWMNFETENYLITEELLSSYDALVISDIEVEFLQSEIQVINDFITNGGSILVYASHPPTSNIPAINELTSNWGISITNISKIPTQDVGITKNYLTELKDIIEINNSHSITSGISKYYWQSGVLLEANDSLFTKELAWYDAQHSEPVLAISEPNGSGKIVVFGNEVPIYSRPTDERRFHSTNVQHKQLLLNIFNWFREENQNQIQVLSNTSSTLSVNDSIELSFYTTNLTNGDVITPDIIKTSVQFPNSTYKDINYFNSSDPGIFSILFQTTTQGQYIFTFNSTIGTQEIIRNISFFVNLGEPEIIEISEKVNNELTNIFTEDMIDETSGFYGSILDKLGDNITICLKVTNTSNLNKVNLHISDIPERFNDMTKFPRHHIQIQMRNNGTHYLASWAPENITAGYQLYYIEIVDANNQVKISPWKYFWVINYHPEISETSTTINGNSLTHHQTTLLTVNPGNEITIDVSTQDLETQHSSLEVFIMLFHYQSLDPQTPGFGSLLSTVKEIEYSNETDSFNGNYVIPSEARSLITNETILELTDKNIALLVITRDKDGGLDLTAILVHISSIPLFFPFSLDSIFVGVVIFIVVLLLCSRRKKKPKDKTKRSPYELSDYSNLELPEKEPDYESQGSISPLELEPDEETFPDAEESVRQRIALRNKQQRKTIFHCPACGALLNSERNMCENCGYISKQ
ncbi:MAG: S8 family serine peptidase [Candidatus Ranarchaeia archaeon]